MTVQEGFDKISAQIEGLQDQINIGQTESRAALLAIRSLAVLLHERGSIDAHDYVRSLRRLRGPQSGTDAVLGQLADGIEGTLKRLSGDEA